MKPFIVSRRQSIAALLAFSMLLFLSTSSYPSQDRSGKHNQGNSLSSHAGGSGGSYEMEAKAAPKPKKKSKLLPVLIVLVVIAVAGYAVYWLATEQSKYTLTVTLAPGVTGTPGAGTHKFKKNSEVSYSYSADKIINVKLQGKAIVQSGTFQMTGADMKLDVSAADAVVEDYNYDPPSLYWLPRVAAEWVWAKSRGAYRCQTSGDNWQYNVFNFPWPQSNYTVTTILDMNRRASFGILLATTNNMHSASGYYIAYKKIVHPDYSNFSVWKFQGKDLNSDGGSAIPIQDWIYHGAVSGFFDPTGNSWMPDGLKIVRSGNTYVIYGFNYYDYIHNSATFYPIYSFTDSSFDPRYVVLLFESRSISTTFDCSIFRIDPN